MKRFDVTYPVGETTSGVTVEASSVRIEDGRLEFIEQGDLVAGFGEFDWICFKREQEPVEQRARKLYVAFAKATGALVTWEQLTEDMRRAWVAVAEAGS